LTRESKAVYSIAAWDGAGVAEYIHISTGRLDTSIVTVEVKVITSAAALVGVTVNPRVSVIIAPKYSNIFVAVVISKSIKSYRYIPRVLLDSTDRLF
jgi:hypothetical protein